MSVLTSQQITGYYDRYKARELTFTREIIEATGLIPNQLSLKCGDEFFPCVLYSSSLEGAKIIANAKTGLVLKLQKVHQAGTLKFCFLDYEARKPINVMVNVKSMGYTPYGGSQDTLLLHLQFGQRPPNDLIVIMGRLMEVDANAERLREERIPISPDSQKKLHIVSQNIPILVQGVRRQGILRDLAFFGAKVILLGLAKFLEEREVVLTLEFNEPDKSFSLKGRFVRTEPVQGRADLVTLLIDFDEALVPMGYKIRINAYLKSNLEGGGEK
jgi:hypothetical protein